MPRRNSRQTKSFKKSLQLQKDMRKKTDKNVGTTGLHLRLTRRTDAIALRRAEKSPSPPYFGTNHSTIGVVCNLTECVEEHDKNRSSVVLR